MPSQTLNDLRSRYPQLRDIPDNELTVRVGNKYPHLLERDKDFASEFKGLTSTTAGGVASQVYQRGVKGGIASLGKIGWGVVEALADQSQSAIDAAAETGGAASAIPFIGKSVQQIAKALPPEAIRGTVGKWASDFGDESKSIIRGIIEEAEEEMPTAFERGAGDIAMTASTIAPTLAASPLGPGAVYAAAGATTFGSTYTDAKDAYEANGDADAQSKAFADALVDGAKTAMLTYVGGKVSERFGGSDIDMLNAAKADKAFRAGVKEFAKRVGVGVGVEGLEEGIDEGISAAIAQKRYDPDADISDAFGQAFLAGAVLAGAAGTIEFGSDYLEAKRQARSAENAGLPGVAQRIIDKAQQKAAEKVAATQTSLEENETAFQLANEDKQTGGKKPVEELPVDPAIQSQIDAMPEVDEADLIAIEADEDAPEPAPQAEQVDLIEQASLTEDQIEDLAQELALSDKGFEEHDASKFEIINQLPKDQQDSFTDAYQFYTGLYKNKTLDQWLKDTGQQPAQQPEQAEPAQAEQPVTQEQPEPETAPIEPAKIEETPAVASLAKRLSKFGAKWSGRNGMKEKGSFKWYAGAGKANQKTGATPYPSRFKNDSQRLEVEKFQADVRKLAEETGVDELDLLNTLKGRVFDENNKTKTRNVSNKQRTAVADANRKAAERIARLDNDTEGGDIIEDLNDRVGKIPVPINSRGKIANNDDIKSSGEFDGIEDFITSVSDYFKRFPAAAAKTFQKVPVADMPNPDSSIQMLRDEAAYGDDFGTSDYWATLAAAIDRRVSRIGRTPEDESEAEAEFVRQQIAAEIEEEAEEDIIYEDSPEPEYVVDDSGPFAAMPPEIVNGVRIDAATDIASMQILSRVKTLLPKIQKNLGGAKVKNIRVVRMEGIPAFTMARSGDFGSVYLNPDLLLQMERDGVGDLERIITEEIIHNYNALAIYREWKLSGSTRSWQEHYRNMMESIYSEMNASEIAETIRYYTNDTPEASPFSGDKVAIAEEYLRILLQRQITGKINEDLFSKIRNRPALSRLIDALIRFWNGLTRGFMHRSPAIKRLKQRARLLMQDKRTSFPPIDREMINAITAASQGFFDFGSPRIAVGRIEQKDSTPKPENGFNNNEGTYTGELFDEAQMSWKSEQIKKTSKLSKEQLEEAQEIAREGDFSEKLFWIDQLDIIDIQTKNALKGVENTLEADVAHWIENQIKFPLPEAAAEAFYIQTKEAIEKSPLVKDTEYETAFWYVYSRLLNNAREFIRNNRNPRETDLELLAVQNVEWRKNFSVGGFISNSLKNFRKRSRSLSNRVTGSEGGLVSLDEALQNASGDTVTRVDIEVVPNPMDIDPRREVVNSEISYVLDKAAKHLNSSQLDMLSYGIDKNFSYGWMNDYSKSRGMSRSAATQKWDSIQANVIVELSSSRLSEFDSDRMRAAITSLPKQLQDEVRKVLDYKDEVAAEFGPADIQRADVKRAIDETRLLQLADKWGITPAAFQSSHHDAANQARSYRGKKDPNAKVVDTDLRPDAVKKRMNDAESTSSGLLDQLQQKAKRALELSKELRRTYIHLDPAKYAEVIEVLRQFDANAELSRAKAANDLRAITSGLNEKQMDKFRRIIIFRDLKRSIDNGLYQNNKNLPFGIPSKQMVEDTVNADNADLLLLENKPIADALQIRKTILADVTELMQERDLLPKNIADGEEYFHRITLEYRNSIADGTLDPSHDLRTGRAGFQRKRKGSEKDYITNYFTSEFEVLSQSYAQLETTETLASLKGLLDKKRAFKMQAKAENLQSLARIGADPSILFARQRRSIGIAISSLVKGLKQNAITYDSRYNDVATDLVRNANPPSGQPRAQHPDFFPFLKHLASTNSGAEMYANMIFKAVREQEQITKRLLGDRYRTWRNAVADSPDFEIWQPEEGNYLYKGTTVSDRALTDWFKQASAGDQTVITPEQLATQLVLGGRREEWAIPSDAAKQLRSMKPAQRTGDNVIKELSRGSEFALAKWKYWKLFHPLGLLKYEINNMSGDADVAFAYDPTIISSYSKDAMKELYDYHTKQAPLSNDLENLMRKGVIGSGWQLQELADSNSEVAYQALFGDMLSPNTPKSQWFKRVTDGYTRKVASLNQMREDTLRVAAYRYFLDKIKAGQTVYGASNPEEVSKIRRPEDKAAKLARELLGDYGAISHGGRWLRTHMIPFWSWMEINAPRYVRMMRNSFLEGGNSTRIAGVMAKKAVMKGGMAAAKTALLAQTLPFFVNLFNEAMIAAGFVDREDKKVIDARNQQHLLLWSSDEGRVVSLRMQGALTDALEWFGLGSIYSDAFDVAVGELNIEDAVDEYFTTGEYWKGAAQRVISGLNPFIKLPVELVSKLRFYPDATKPSPMRDRMEYALSALEMGWASSAVSLSYNLWKDFPRRGGGAAGNLMETMINVVTYSTDTGEAAYNYIKAKEYQFYREKEGDSGWFTTNDKSDALYYRNRARSWGDKDAEKRWEQVYFDLGGKKADIRRSEKNRAPLAKVGTKYRRQFLQSLTETERALLESAKQWHRERTGVRGQSSDAQ